MKNRYLLIAGFAAFAASGGVFADCSDEIEIQEARTTSHDTEPSAQELQALRTVDELLDEAVMLCEQGAESEVTNILEQVKPLLTDVGR